MIEHIGFDTVVAIIVPSISSILIIVITSFTTITIVNTSFVTVHFIIMTLNHFCKDHDFHRWLLNFLYNYRWEENNFLIFRRRWR